MCEFKTFLWSGVKQKERGHILMPEALILLKKVFMMFFFSENCWYNAVDFQLLTHSSGVIQTKGNEKMPAIQ